VGALALVNHYAQEAWGEPSSPSPISAQETNAGSTPVSAGQTNASAVEEADADVSDAPFQPITKEKPLPANVSPTGPAAEVIRLAESGVEEGVLLAYVTNSVSPFNLSPDAIIYLNDIGVPGPVVTAMIQRDQVLKGLAAADGAQIAAGPPQPAPTEQYAPVPEMPAPETAPAPTAPPDEMASDTAPPPDYGPPEAGVQPVDGASYTTFYDALAPYGSWVDVSGYGPCWQPTVVVGNPYWRPYFNGGRWVYSDCGWYWLSGYSWGWAPFHYGRWFRHNRLGWCWSPDTTWGPSWVSWRYGASHCAWAPLPPGAAYHQGVGLTYHGRHVDSHFGFGLGAHAYAVVPFNHFYDRHVSRYGVPQREVSHALRDTVVSTSIGGSNNRVINNGLPPSRVTAATGARIHRVAVHDAQTSVRGARAERMDANGTAVSAFRPNFSQGSGTQAASATGMNRPGARNTLSGTAASATFSAPGHSALAPTHNSRTAVAEGQGGRTDPVGTSTARPTVSRPISTPHSGTQSAPAGWMNRNAGAKPGAAAPALRTPSQYGVAASANNYQPAGAAVPRGSLVLKGKRQLTSQTSEGTAQAARMPQNASPKANTYTYQRAQTTSAAGADLQRPAGNSWSAPQAVPAQRQVSASAYRAPEVQRPAPSYNPPPRAYSAPAPSYTPPPQVHYTPAPAPSFTPRAEATASRPTYSAPAVAAPSASAPAAQAHSPSGARWGR
jgi:hypothetical protein